MYEATRMIYENECSLSTLTASVFDSGVFSAALKNGTGSATMQVQGGFTANHDLLYTFDTRTDGGASIGTGEIGSTILWYRTNDTAVGSWDGYITTSTAYQTISNGLQVKFTAGSGADFVLGDRFYVLGSSTFSSKNLFDERRDTYTRKYILEANAEYTNTWTFHFPDMVAGTKLALCLMDYGTVISNTNTTNYGTCQTFQVRAGTDVGIDDYTKTLTWNPDTPLIAYLDDLDPDVAYTYFAIDIMITRSYTDTTAKLYLYIGQMIIGEYIEFPTAAMWNWGSQHDRQTGFFGNNQNIDVVRQISSQRRIITANWVNLKATDFAILEALYDSIFCRGDNIEHPVFFHEFSDVADRVYWMKAVDGALNRTYTGFNRDDTTLKLMEVSANYVL